MQPFSRRLFAGAVLLAASTNPAFQALANDDAGAQNAANSANIGTPPVASQGLSEKIDAAFSAYDAPDAPGCAVGVIHEGAYVHARGYGAANLEHGVPIDRNSVFRTGSVSKQFTAHAVAILAARGDLDLDADVHDFIPELADYRKTVTVRQMVHHVSGMGDYERRPVRFEVAPGKRFRFGDEDYWTTGEFLENVARQPLAREPGEKYQYSNLAYFLLGQVVERVSGQSLREFADAEMFAPLGMTDTFFNDDVREIVPNRAAGYRPRRGGDGYEIYMTNLEWVGEGGLFSTLNDFLKWDQAFIRGEIPGGAAVETLILTPHPTTTGKTGGKLLDKGAGYGFGLNIGTFRGLPVHAHGGSWVGFRAFYARFPEDDFSVVAMCNRSDGLSGGKNRTLMNIAVDAFGR